MKRLMNVFIAVMMCLGFAGGFLGCEKEVDSPPSEAKKITPQVGETIPPRETPPVPSQRQPQESQVTEMTKVKGSITAISPDTGRVIIGDESGKEIVLNASKDVDLKAVSVGDKVVVEYTRDMLIRSIEKGKPSERVGRKATADLSP
jgi:hypothetical protein